MLKWIKNRTFIKQFRKWDFERSMLQGKIAFPIGTVCYMGLGLIDFWFVSPELRTTVWFWRGVFIAGSWMIYITGFFTPLKKYHQGLIAALGFEAGISMVVVCSFLPLELIMYYYPVLMLITFWTYNFSGTRFLYALIVDIGLLAIYNITSLYEQMPYEHLVTHDIFLLSANLIGGSAGYLTEKARQKLFQSESAMVRVNKDLAEQNILYSQELRMAQNLQQKMVMSRTIYQNAATVYIPMREVGGDNIDIIDIPGTNKIGLFISDVSGHGVSAALLMMISRTIVSNMVTEENKNPASTPLNDPALFLKTLDGSLAEHLHGHFISAFYAVYDTGNRNLEYCSAGHPPPLILCRKNNQIDLSFIDTSGMGVFLGVSRPDEKAHYFNRSMKMETKGRLILYSDGLMDAFEYNYENMDTGINSFNKTPLYGFFSESMKLSAVDTARRLEEVVETNRIQAYAQDDICAIILDT